eukprot:gene13958-18722_t
MDEYNKESNIGTLIVDNSSGEKEYKTSDGNPTQNNESFRNDLQSEDCAKELKFDSNKSYRSIIQYDDKQNSEINNNKKNENEYFCQICFENCDQSLGYTLPCGHTFCKYCIIAYLRSKVNDGIVYPKCFYEISSSSSTSTKTCQVEISSKAIISLLTDDDLTLSKYTRYKYAKDNKDARECPSCSTFQIGNPDLTPRMICQKCTKEFCFFHSNAHDFSSQTCEEYEKSIAKEIELSITFIESCSKPCPGCKLPVMKAGGCNHMKCQCGVAFCWLCGKQIDDAHFPAHFQWWNPSGCSNLQLNESEEPTPTARVCARMLSIIQIILIGPLTLASTIASSILCFTCIAYKLKVDPNMAILCGDHNLFSICMSSWGIIWMLLLFFLPVALIIGSTGLALGIAFAIILFPCYCCIRKKSPAAILRRNTFERSLSSLRRMPPRNNSRLNSLSRNSSLSAATTTSNRANNNDLNNSDYYDNNNDNYDNNNDNNHDNKNDNNNNLVNILDKVIVEEKNNLIYDNNNSNNNNEMKEDDYDNISRKEDIISFKMFDDLEK